MNKKIFTLALLAVFVLAQFSMASAAPSAASSVIAGTATLTGPTFNAAGSVDLEWSATGMPASSPQYASIWYRQQPSTAWGCWTWWDVSTLASANGTYSTSLAGFSDQDVVEFLMTLDNGGCSPTPADEKAAMTSIFVDNYEVDGVFYSFPNAVGDWGDNASCNTFEFYALVSDSVNVIPDGGFSGFDTWNQATTGTFAPPAPDGSENAELSWIVNLPATASGPWDFYVNPEDVVGNQYGDVYYREANFGGDPDISPDELEDCADFSDTAGHADEVYIRYLADIGVIAGNSDGSFGPDNTLTRAEAATLFEKANGHTDETNLPDTAPAGCDFPDVAATDWFSGWVWAACEDGFMNGLADGNFGPADLLTRGQVVTIFNNIVLMGGGDTTSNDHLDFTAQATTLSDEWGGWTDELRSAAWTDIFIGDYYAMPAIYAYGIGVADGTSATTFSPNQPILRGEFAKMYYRALAQN